MLMQHFLSILCLIFTIYSCKCQDLEKFVAPILDNQKAPLVAIVDTTNISAHIVRSIEIPLRNIINTTVSCKLNEELKKDIVSGQVLSDVKGQLETLQQKIDKHIEENGIQITDVKHDIASSRMDTEETISHEILEQKEDMTKLVDTLKSDQDAKIKNLTSNVVLMQSEVQKKVEEHIGDSRNELTVVKQVIATLRKEMEGKILENMNYFAEIVNTVNKDLDEKMKNLTNNVEIMQLEFKKTVLSVDNNASNLAEQLVKHSNRLDALQEDFSGKTSAIQSDINKVMSTANIHNELLGGHDSRLVDLKAKFNAMNSRVAMTARPPRSTTLSGTLKFEDVTFSDGINNLPTYKSTGKFVVEKEGLYLISVAIRSNTNNAQYYIYLNGNIISYTMIAYTSYNPSSMQHTGTVVLARQLHPNDSLWVYLPSIYYIVGGEWSTFTIVKIK